MDKKKVAFVANCCVTGGVETALINLLNTIDTQKYEITLYTNFEGNPVVKNIPSEIICVDLDNQGIKTVFYDAVSNRNMAAAFTILKNYALFRLTRSWYKKSTMLYRHSSFKFEEYDWVIAYKFGSSTVFLTTERIVAKKSILWVHGEFPSFDNNYLNALRTFDKCFCVSEYCKQNFLKYCVDMRNKTDVFHNIVNVKKIQQDADVKIDDIETDRAYILVTVGRLGKDKGQIVIPTVAAMLEEHGVDFAWYVIGDGTERKFIEDKIRSLQMEKRVRLLGTKENPFPYVKACTIYVQTSVAEGWCLTTQEARILHKPCVVTNIPVMHEQFVDKENGIIAEGTDAVSLYEGIMHLIRSPKLRDKIVNNLMTHSQDNSIEIQKLYNFLDD